MTMYLPNGDVRPTGYEAGEFIEPPTIPPARDPSPEIPEAEDDDDEMNER
jgi:hypothetical protein